MTNVLLKTLGLVKAFPGALALNEISVELREREVLGLVGENGAGKSTLLKVLAGALRPDAGQVLLRGRPVSVRSVAEAHEHGIAMVFQEQSLLLNASVAENILLGHEGDAIRGGIYNWRRLEELAELQLEKLEIQISPRAVTGSLSFGQRQLVELAKALAIEDRMDGVPIILLDEPTSVLEGNELEVVLAQIERLKSRASVVLVSHRLEEVLRVSDRVYVMTNGSCVAERTPENSTVAELQRLMLGRSLEVAYSRGRNATVGPSAVRLEAKNIGRRGRVAPMSFQARAGAIVGLAGVEGSGRETLSRMLCGAEPVDEGELLLDGTLVRFDDCSQAVAQGVGYIPSERRTEGVVGGMSVRENMTLAHIGTVLRGPFISRSAEKRLADHWVKALQIKTPSIETPIDKLSGGNQQKVVLSKWMLAPNLRLLVLDHPMRGLDVGAKTEVFKLIEGLAARGVAIVLIADTLDELLALSDDVIVMRDGKVSARFVSLDQDKSPTRLRVLESMV